MGKKKGIKPEQWATLIEECRSSGSTVADWCKEHNISTRSYHYWCRKLDSDKCFVELPDPDQNSSSSANVDTYFRSVTLPCSLQIIASRFFLISVGKGQKQYCS